jgi:hypothetical protein
MAQATPEYPPNVDIVRLPRLDAPWTADVALELLPETNGPHVEIFHGSMVVSPHASVDHQIITANLRAMLRPATRAVGLFVYQEINIRSMDDLFIPDVAVMRRSGAGQKSMDIADAVMLVEIVSDSNRKKDVIERPPVYAEAGVPWFMRVEFRGRVPGIMLFELVDREYKPLLGTAGGTPFVMDEPFSFTIDPADLLDE